MTVSPIFKNEEGLMAISNLPVVWADLVFVIITEDRNSESERARNWSSLRLQL